MPLNSCALRKIHSPVSPPTPQPSNPPSHPLSVADPLERLLRCENEAAFRPLAEALWEAGSDAEAEAALRRLAGDSLAGWEEELRAGGDRGRDEGQAEG